MGKDKLLIRDILYVVLFAALFFLIQFVFEIGGALVYGLGNNLPVSNVITDMSCGKYSKLLTATVVLSSLVTVALYGKLKWAPVSPTYLRSKPWAVIAWVVFLALGSILPLEWIYEHIQISMPGHLSQLFEGIMKEPWGYVAIGLLVPVAEEMVFRGAILRKLLEMFAAPAGSKGDATNHWYPIIISALIFGVMHGNMAQGVHAFIIGLLLGWMYYRTRSVIPSIAFHWINNSIAYVMFNFMPQMNDGKLIDLFHGDDKMMYMGLAFSLCIFIPAIIQLAAHMKPAK